MHFGLVVDIMITSSFADRDQSGDRYGNITGKNRKSKIGRNARMENAIRFGIIGPGSIAKKFCAAVRLVNDAEVVAAASRTPGKAQAFIEEFGIPKAYTSYEEMVSDSDIDAVYIATTHNFHYENLLLCLRAGKHVLCEKAMVLTRAQAETVFALATEKGRFCMEATWSRFLPAIQKAREWIQKGVLGQIEMANCVLGFCSDPNPEGRIRNPKLAGGALYDIGVYGIEITDYLIPEELREVTSALTFTEQGVDKLDNITLRYDNCVANLQLLVTGNVVNALDIYGTKGRIHIPSPISGNTCEWYDASGLRESFYSRLDNGFEYEIQEMVDCIRSGKLESDVIPHRDTIRCADIFDQCLGTK